jgi:hypothetical protein
MFSTRCLMPWFRRLMMVVDGNADRLETARLQNAEAIDFNAEDPVEVVRELTGGVGADRVIDAVGVDAGLDQGRAGAERLRRIPAEPRHPLPEGRGPGHPRGRA